MKSIQIQKIALSFTLFSLSLFFPGKISGEKNRWFSVYFTSPVKSSRGISAGKNPENQLINTINRAEKKFYGAFYDISSLRVADALVKARKRGVEIRIVTEDDNLQDDAVKRLRDGGIPVVSDNRRGLMHNKFAVIDDSILWTGSYNLTRNGAWKNNNNAIKIYSRALARIYLHEFNEMFDRRIFGNRKEKGPFGNLGKKYYVKIGKTPVNAYFAPEDNVERIILRRLHRAKRSIRFMAFSFTSDRIGETVIRKHDEGLDVKGIFERNGTGSRHSEYVKMKIEGVPVKRDRNRNNMHHKVFIIDEKIVITGSYNFSRNANRNNDENILIISNREIARTYLDEFRRLYR
jgi:phosphatidylserine/phosphatidylglycerophosphate/cardiolipin synthase-like enzyme